MIPFDKKGKKAGTKALKSSPMPRKVSGSAKKNKTSEAVRDAFSETATDTPPRMRRVVR